MFNTRGEKKFDRDCDHRIHPYYIAAFWKWNTPRVLSAVFCSRVYAYFWARSLLVRASFLAAENIMMASERSCERSYVRTSRELALETGDKEGVSTAAIMIALSGSLTPVHRCTEPHVASAVHRCSGCTSRRVHMHRTALSARHPGTHARVHALYVSPAIHHERAELEKEGNNERVPCNSSFLQEPRPSSFFLFLSLSLSFPLYTNTFYV